MSCFYFLLLNCPHCCHINIKFPLVRPSKDVSTDSDSFEEGVIYLQVFLSHQKGKNPFNNVRNGQDLACRATQSSFHYLLAAFAVQNYSWCVGRWGEVCGCRLSADTLRECSTDGLLPKAICGVRAGLRPPLRLQHLFSALLQVQVQAWSQGLSVSLNLHMLSPSLSSEPSAAQLGRVNHFPPWGRRSVRLRYGEGVWSLHSLTRRPRRRHSAPCCRYPAELLHML